VAGGPGSGLDDPHTTAVFRPLYGRLTDGGADYGGSGMMVIFLTMVIRA